MQHAATVKVDEQSLESLYEGFQRDRADVVSGQSKGGTPTEYVLLQLERERLGSETSEKIFQSPALRDVLEKAKAGNFDLTAGRDVKMDARQGGDAAKQNYSRLAAAPEFKMKQGPS